MTTRLHRGFLIALGCSISLFVAHPVLADDTEIFVGQTLDSGQANVLFIIDTSGSMGSKVDWEIPYEFGQPYVGACENDRMYWAKQGDEPDCNGDDWIEQPAFVCEQGWNVLSGSGFYTDRMAQFQDENKIKDREWKQLDSDEKQWIVDCQADFGRHGDGTDSLAVYPSAEDISPYDTEPDGPNVIDWLDHDEYTVYEGGYLNYTQNPVNREITRLDVVKDVVRDTLSSVSSINIGMMRFDEEGHGGMVTRKMAPINSEFTLLTNALDDYEDGGNTPLAETLYEAGQYFAGRNVVYGANAHGNDGRTEPSVGSAISGSKYVSPIANSCQKNYVVLLTDGEPTSDDEADDSIKGLPGFFDATGQNACVGNCLDEMAAYLHHRDLNSTLTGDQTAEVFTIGFHTDQQLLSDAASRGGGEYFTADNAEDLSDAFIQIFENIIERDTSFAAPAIAVNTFNRLTHRDELYLSLFKPTNNPHWEGNLKRYRLDNSGGDKAIYDATNQPAISATTGTFDENAKSFWTLGDPDGFDTVLGGFRSRLTADRNIYTITDGDQTDVPLTADSNRVHEDNTALTAQLLGVTATERTSLIQYARGVDADGTALKILGDALHSRPVVLSWGGTQANPDLTLFYTTNDGYFHAVDPTATATEDMELFSFIPAELLSRLAVLKANQRNNPPKFYGLDGPMTYLLYNDDGDRVIESGERALLYFGMRRGGRNYYALDVTDRANPKLAWSIIGGEGLFGELGQSWSEMTPARVKINGSVKDVLIFGGGYDTRQDPAGTNVADDMGRAIYMVDALTGQQLWWAGDADSGADLTLDSMTNSIPSDLRVLDVNGDHVDDRIYVGDMTGQMWRFDIHNNTATSRSNLVTGGVIADIGGTGNAGNRRIFYPPSVSLIADDYLGSFLAVSFGTGHRANPLGTSGKTVDDRFYMLKDPYLFRVPVDADGVATYTRSTETNLYDVTTETAPSTSQLTSHRGWYIRLDNEEKVLAKPLAADGKIFFNTYVPASAGVLTCSPTATLGSGRTYTVLIGSGAPPPTGEPVDPDEPPTDDPVCQNRCDPTPGPIPPEPVLIFTEPDNDPPPCPVGEVCEDPCDGIADVAMIIGTEVVDPEICTGPVRTYWYADSDD